MIAIPKIKKINSKIYFLTALAAAALFVLPSAPASAAACSAPATDYGTVKGNVTAPSTATYRLWSRIMAPNDTNNSYLLEVDGTNCYVVGGKKLTTNTWTWVDYQNGNSATKIDLNLTKGSHSVKFIGRQANVKLDRFIITSDLACTPEASGNGDNCNTPTDTTPPTVNITAPTEGAPVYDTAKITADASDSVGVTKVEFYINSSLYKTVTAAPYTFEWDTTDTVNGTYLIIAKAYDAAGNVGTDNLHLTVKNKDTELPTTPTDLTAKAAAYNKVDLVWKASTDNEAVSGYTIVRNGVPLASTGGTTTQYQDTTVMANNTYDYQVAAYDTTGNASELTAKVNVKTPNIPDTIPPAAPAGFSATAASPTQANLKWKPSTDNIGVTKYQVYRQTAGGAARVVGEAADTSFGDADLTPGTEYTYYAVAKDGAGNTSEPSAKATVMTPTPKPLGVIQGRVFSGKTNRPTGYAKVETTVNGKQRLYVTNKKGEYEIRDLKPGAYSVTYSKSIYFSQSLTLRVNNNTVNRDVTLKLK